MQRHIHSHDTSAYRPRKLLPAQEGTLTGADNPAQRPGPDTRLKKITEHLYECPPDGTDCPHRFSFGYRNYCSWLLNQPDFNTKNLDDTPPCFIK